MWKVVRWALRVFLWAFLLSVITPAVVYVYFTSDPALPAVESILNYHPKLVTRVLANDGQLIGELFEERRTVVPRERIPRVVISAFVDAEDAQFFEHRGLNYMSIVRAVIQSLMEGHHLRGASTITQQLVKTYVLKSRERSLRRKVQETYLALRLERKLQDKEAILWLYLNQIYFGHGRFGIEEAARFYFGKSVSDVNAGEAAVLASLPKGPEEYSPRRNPERAKNRQRYVLSQMARYKHISQEEAQKFAEEPIVLVKEPPPLSNLAPEFVDEVEKMLAQKYPAARLPYLGLHVRTTCDLAIQRAVRESLEHRLQWVDERNGYRGRQGKLEGAALAAHLAQLKKEYPSGPPVGHLLDGVVTKVLDDDGDNQSGWAMVALGATAGTLPLPAAPDRYNPKGLPASQRFAPGDVLHVRVARLSPEGAILTLEQGPQGAVIVIDPQTRHVLAMVGGYGQSRSYFNRALYAKRQPGSTFKTFVFATAFQSHLYTPASILNDSPLVYYLPGLAPCPPKNASAHNSPFMGPVRLRVALARSLNTVACQLIYYLKPGPVIAMARSLGIESELESRYLLALGTSEVSLVELTNSYATLAARGRHAEPLILLQVDEEPPAHRELAQAVSPELAFLMSSVLQSVIEEGTAASIRGKLRRPAAGKTGSTGPDKFLKDAWFVGYTPDMAAGVWVGFDYEQRPAVVGLAAEIAVPIWLEVMQTALRDRRTEPFVQPPDAITVRIDPRTGQPARRGRPAIDEVFLEGTAPGPESLRPGESDPSNFRMD